ncbi:MAG TPA: PKD domain-containing protein, partial [Flavisolibacter sp.]|nr:PKD domain-containing protein [Flavisolibacter sp.]
MSKKTLYTVAFLFLYVFISTVSFGQAPVANFTSNVSGGCAPLVVNFQDQSTGNPTTWTWDLGNSSTSSKANPSVFYFTPGVYQIKLTVTNASGTSTQTGTITVYENPAPDFVSDFQQGCAPLKVQFTDQSTAGTGNTNATWAWDFGNGTKSSDQNPVVEYNTPGTFPVVLKVTNDKGCSKVVTKTNYINATPGVQPSFTTTVPSPCAAPFPVIFTNTSTGPGHI